MRSVRKGLVLTLVAAAVVPVASAPHASAQPVDLRVMTLNILRVMTP